MPKPPVRADLARVFLYIPAHDERKVAKALAGSGADALILDLEDGVPPSEREKARRQVTAQPPQSHTPILVRVNAVGSQAHAADLAAVCAARGVKGVVLAKADAAGVRALAPLLPEGLGLWPLIESAAGIASLPSLPNGPPLAGLLLGAGDLLADLGARWTRDELPLLHARSQLVLTASACGIPAIDTPDAEFRDLELLAERSMRARDLGFAGKAAIHPAQLDVIRSAFMPGEDEIRWARGVLANAAGGGAWTSGSEVQDAATVRRARRILEGVE
jgi:citrate lyase subunit beta/citryl-CoA lyase